MKQINPGGPQGGMLAFDEWLKTRIKARNMTQRQLAQLSGVHHSSISRLIRGERVPSLDIASKLADVLVHAGDIDAPGRFRAVAKFRNPTSGVEYALRLDDLLSEADVREVMQLYLARRLRGHAARASFGSQRAGGTAE